MYSVVHRFIRIHCGLGLTTLAPFYAEVGQYGCKDDSSFGRRADIL